MFKSDHSYWCYSVIFLLLKNEQQELNDCQNKNRRAETNETPNKTQLILTYPGKQGRKTSGKTCFST